VVVTDERYTPFATRRPPPPPRASETLWTLGKADRRITCELLDDGAYGCEAQLHPDGAFYAGRRFADGAHALEHVSQVRARLEAEEWTLVPAQSDG
jgi:hypothetical protein